MSFLNSANAAPPPPSTYVHLTPIVIALATSMDAAHDTYQLVARLDMAASNNVYTIFGTNESPMDWPPAYQCASPFGGNVGGTNVAFWGIANNAALGYAEFDSWLSVGISAGDTAGALSTIGLDFTAWDENSGLATSDGAVFWMTPDDAPGADSMIGQITVASGSSGTVTMGMQGRSAGVHAAGSDWTEINVVFEYP